MEGWIKLQRKLQMREWYGHSQMVHHYKIKEIAEVLADMIKKYQKQFLR